MDSNAILPRRAGDGGSHFCLECAGRFDHGDIGRRPQSGGRDSSPDSFARTVSRHQPAGMAYDPVTKWLLVAETGINAVGVVDTEKNQLIGHIPAGWMPDARGHFRRPGLRRERARPGDRAELAARPSGIRGSAGCCTGASVSTFIMPEASEISGPHASGLFPEGIRAVIGDRAQASCRDPPCGADRQGEPSF